MNFIKKVDRKIWLYTGIIISCIILFIIFIFILKLLFGGKISPKIYESRLKKAAISYYEKYPDKLPKQDGSKTTISIDELEKSGSIKKQSSLLKDNVTCQGEVNISKNNGYYLYQPVIKCSDKYETDLLYKKILEDNPLTETSDGLYQISNYYLFRGENINNHIVFANKNWRILRINSDNTIKLLLNSNDYYSTWDNRYNSNEKYRVGKNIYKVSRIKELLDNYIENNNVFSEQEKAYIVPSKFCIGSRKPESTEKNGTSECSSVIENQALGLLAAYEYGIVSLDSKCKKIEDSECSNYNYIANMDRFWTITPSSEDSYSVYEIDGTAELEEANSYSTVGIVLNLSSDAIYKSGDGSEDNPYIIK